MTLLSPSVIPLEPSSQLTNSHHALPSTSYYPLASSSSSSTLCPATTPAKPRYFLNPWPSYRVASLSDAYRAYQLGAAIAHPQPRTPSRPRTPATGLSRTGSSATLDEEEPYISSSVSVSEVEDEDTSANAALLRIPPSAWYPARIYARKDLAEMYQDDEEDDWRDPPVTVVPPSWTGEEGPLDKEAVTWLGHAGVLVRIPWKGKGRNGMCGVLFDPIFSYRSVRLTYSSC
jgi:N-acyl-phosphatidylethanolamine-hydrolysing phospholipase D